MNPTEIKVKRSEDVVSRVISGEIVALMPEKLSLHAMTGCGSRVWELIEEESRLSDIIRTICEEYEVEPAKAEEEITGFMNQLAEAGLVNIEPKAV